MKVTSFYPVFTAEKMSDEMLEFYADMGMKKLHSYKLANKEILVFGNEAGQRVDVVVGGAVPNENRLNRNMRVNVDNFDEGVAYFEARGFKAEYVHDGESARVSALVNSNDPSNIILLYYHKKG